MKRFILILTCFPLILTDMQAQGNLDAALAQIKAAGTYETLIYYGVDVSHVRVNDAAKIPRSPEYSQVYPAAWIAYVAEELSPENYVRPRLGFPDFLYRQQEIYEQSVVPDSGLITGHDNTLSPDVLASMVKHYPLLAERGLGLVLIPETFSKPRETADTWVVFFDVGSREILYRTKAFGTCKHMGYTAHWGSGIVNGFRNFVNR